jgi:hypothetical protein
MENLGDFLLIKKKFSHLKVKASTLKVKRKYYKM